MALGEMVIPEKIVEDIEEYWYFYSSKKALILSLAGMGDSMKAATVFKRAYVN